MALQHKDIGPELSKSEWEATDAHEGRITKSNLGWTANKLLKGTGVGSDPTEVDMPSAYLQPTRSFTVIPGFTSGFSITSYGNYATGSINTGKTAHWSFGVPADFGSIISIKIVFVEQATQNIDWTVMTDFSADGETHPAHSDSMTADDYTNTYNRLGQIDITNAFTGLASGDRVGCKLAIDSDDGTQWQLLYMEFNYAE